MVTSIRRYMQTTTYRYILSAAVMLLIITMLFSSFIMREEKNSHQWIIDVNGTKISEIAFRRKTAEQQEFLNRFRQAYGSYADMLLQSMGFSNDPKQLAHQALIQEELLNYAAQKLGIYAHFTSIARELNNPRFVMQQGLLIPPYVMREDGSINEHYLHKHLQRMGISLTEFDQLLAQSVERQMVQTLVASAAYVSDNELRQRFADENLGKKFSIATFSLDTFLKNAKNTKLSDQEIQSFFDKENTQFKRYWVAEKRGGSVWKFNPQTYGVSVSDSEVVGFYDDNKINDYVDQQTKVQVRRILLPVTSDADMFVVQNEAMALHRDLLAGSVKFSDKAKDVTPFFARGEKEHAFERAAFILKNVDDISPVIRTTEGFEILQLAGKKMRTFVPFEKVKGDIKQKLVLKKFKTEFVQDMKELLEKPGQKNLETFIKIKGGKQEVIKPMVQDQSGLSKALFAIDKKDSLNFYVDKEIGYAVQLTALEEPFLPTLESIKDVVMNDIYEARAAKNLRTALEQAKKDAIENPESIFGAKSQVQREETGWIKKENVDQVKSLEKRGISAEQILQLEKIGSVSLHMSERSGYLVRLEALEPFNEALFATKKDALENKLNGEQTKLLVEGFVASLYRNATISVNEPIMNLYQEYSI